MYDTISESVSLRFEVSLKTLLEMSSAGWILPRIEGFSREILYFVEVVLVSLIATCITCQCCCSSSSRRNHPQTQRRRRNRVSMCCRT